MKPEEKRLLKMLFYDAGGRFFEVIDKDGLRKPAIETRLADVEKPTKEHGFDEEIWTVKINWRLLDKWIGDEE